MRPDYLKQIRRCAFIPRTADIQIHRACWYRGKYNGKVFERLKTLLVERHVPMPRLMDATWGGHNGVVQHGAVFAGSGRIDRQVYRLDRGRYWVRLQNADGK